MKILVGQHDLQLDKKDIVNQNEYKITKCEFEFDEAITNDLVKIALFTNSAGTYKQYIINNECDIPAEILEKQGITTLGVYAYKEKNGELELRYSPEEIKFYVSNGSYKENAENTEPITPTDKEQMEQALQNGLNNINNKIDEVDEKLDGIETAIEETNNLNLDVSDKVDGDVTVTLTKKDASTKTVVLSDGTSLEFNWDGTKLGIKTSDEQEYTYVDLQGIQGIPGPQGEPFRIKKTYPSVAEMNADFNNMEYGDYVMIASSVEVEDNAKLYTRGATQWIFITDFSGATGIRGPVGPTPNIQIGIVTSGSTPSVTRTGTDENPVLNFVLQKGDKGDKGNTGDTGNGISSIEKTSTSGLVDTYTITYTNGNTTTFDVSNGNGIDRIEKTATVGNKDTYTIYFTNGETTTYEVSNGEVTREELQEEVERLSMIYNAFPSTTGEVEEGSINGTAEVPFKEIGLKGNTSQEGTPTPDTPVPVEVVTGDNTIKVEGKNLFDKDNVIKGYRLGNNGLPSISDNSYCTTDYFIAVEPNTTYYSTSVINQAKAVCFYDSNQNFIERVIYKKTNTFTTGSTTHYIKMSILLSEIDTQQLEKGNQATDYTPYQSQTYPINLGSMELCKIGDYQDYIAKSTGKNLFDRSITPELYSYSSSGVKVSDTDLCINQELNNIDFSSIYVSFSSIVGSAYVRICEYNSSGTFIKRTIVNTNRSLTLDSNTKKIIFSVNASSAKYFTNLMINEGTTALPYEPYGKVWCKYGAIGKIASYNGETITTNYISTTGGLDTGSTIYYVQNTPTITPITDTTLIEQLDNLEKAYSYDTQTNISQTNQDKPFIISYEAILSLKNVLNS